MTLVLALHCSDGLVLAADGQSTLGTTGQPVRMPIDKIRTPWINLAWSAAGQVALIQRVEQELTKRHAHPRSFATKSIAEIRRAMTEAVVNATRAVVMNQFVQVQGQMPADTSYLFVGCGNDGPLMVEVGVNFLDADHIGAGYAAIGSGDIFPYFALAGLKHFDVANRTLAAAKLIAYRVLQDAIGVAAFGLGEPIGMVEITKGDGGRSGTARRMSDADLRVLKDKVDEWRQVESDALTEFVLGPSPDPERLGDAESSDPVAPDEGVTGST